MKLANQAKESTVAGCRGSVPDPSVQDLSEPCTGSEIQVQDGDQGGEAGAEGVVNEPAASPSSGELRVDPEFPGLMRIGSGLTMSR